MVSAAVRKRGIRVFAPYLLLAPAVVLAVAFLALPAILSLGLSFQSHVLIDSEEATFVGLANYIRIFQDLELRQTIFNSIYILAVTVGLSFLGAITVASALNRRFRGRRALLVIVILPWAFPPVVNALLWSNVVSPTYGGLNGLLFGLGAIDRYLVWTNDPLVTLTVISLVILWKQLPIMAIIVLAAMQAIPDELYEAAQIDGANSFRRFQYVTFPAIMPSLAIVMSLATIVALNVFDEIYVIAKARGDTRSLAMEAYFRAFRYLDLGFGSAIAYVLLLVGGLFTILYVRRLYKEIET